MFAKVLTLSRFWLYITDKNAFANKTILVHFSSAHPWG